MVVDHRPPLGFARLVDDWLADSQYDHAHRWLTDADVAAFVAYHRQHAQLRWLCASCNSMMGDRSEIWCVNHQCETKRKRKKSRPLKMG